MMYHLARALYLPYYRRVLVCFEDTEVFVSLLCHFENETVNTFWVIHGDYVSPAHRL